MVRDQLVKDIVGGARTRYVSGLRCRSNVSTLSGFIFDALSRSELHRIMSGSRRSIFRGKEMLSEEFLRLRLRERYAERLIGRIPSAILGSSGSTCNVGANFASLFSLRRILSMNYW